MTFEEFQSARDIDLLFETKRCFDKYNSPLTGGGDKPACLLEAQFYIQELGRREDSKIARRDFRLELIVILLIFAEIVIALYEGHAQAVITASQTQILENLQSSTKSTADSLAAQMKLQYEVFVNVQYNGSKGLSLFNNSKNEIVFFGIKVGNHSSKPNKGGPEPIAGLNMKSIYLEEFYPGLFDNLPQQGAVALPIVLYLKSANQDEYIAEGTFTFLRKGSMVSGSGEIRLRAEKWSGAVTL
jgi:hypothetical protein